MNHQKNASPTVDLTMSEHQLNLTSSQKSASLTLERMWNIKSAGIAKVGGTETRPIPLLVGPSGSGKSAVVRDFAQRKNLPMFSLTATTWIVWGAKNDDYTMKALATFVSNHSQGIIFVDELNKLRSNHLDNSWSMSVTTEVMTLLDSDSRLLQLGFNAGLLAKLQNGFMIVGAGAWHDQWMASRHKASAGFGGTEAAAEVDPALFLETISSQTGIIPEELLYRFNDRHILITPPSEAEIAERIALIREPLNLPPLQQEELKKLAAQAVASDRSMRWLEAYAMEMLDAAGLSAVPARQPDEASTPELQPNKPKKPDFANLYNSIYGVVLRLAYETSLASQDLAWHIQSESLHAESTERCCNFLTTLSNTCHHFTLPIIGQTERRLFFNQIHNSAATASDQLSGLLSKKLINTLSPGTAEALFRTLGLTMQLTREAAVITRIMDNPEDIAQQGTSDRPDPRAEWFKIRQLP